MSTRVTKLKVCCIGNAEVGKTSIVAKRAGKELTLEYMSTQGVNYSRITSLVDGEEVWLEIFDTCGSERYNSVTKNYFRGAEVCVLVYDVTNESSFHKLKKWRERFLENNNPRKVEDVLFVVLGNKMDLKMNASTSAAEEWCAANGMWFFATSAITGLNCTEVFDLIAAQGKMIRERKKIEDDAEIIAVRRNRRNRLKMSCKCVLQ